MDRYHGIINPSKIEWDPIPKENPGPRFGCVFEQKKRYSGFFFFGGVIFGRSCRSVFFLEFSANFDVEDWKMTLEELRLGYSNLWDQTWNFSKRSVETGKLQHSHSAVSLFPSIFITTSLAASCFHWV